LRGLWCVVRWILEPSFRPAGQERAPKSSPTTCTNRKQTFENTKSAMNKLHVLLVFILFTACSGGLNDNEKTIASADAAYEQLNLKKSHKILEAVLSIDTLQNDQKCEVLRKLALQDWKFYKNYDLARKMLTKADSIGNSKFDTWMLRSRIERESKHFDSAQNAAIKAEHFAQSKNEINDTKVEYAQSSYDFLVNNMEKGNPIDTNLLIKTSKILSTVLETNAGMPKPSKLLLGVALLNNNGANVLKAWQSYFQIQDIHHAYPYLSRSAEELNQVCENWHGNKLKITDQEKLINALASSRFYTFIPGYAKANGDESDYNQKIRDFITYSKYLKEVKNRTNEYYRLIAIGKANEGNYKKWLNSEREKLWNNLSFTSQKTYSENAFLDETKKHFGALGFTGGTGNYKGYVLCLGHIVNQETATVEQYGYKPELTYTQVDMMASNGYSSWFWENSNIGGWASNKEIIRVREAYLDGPFDAWKTITDTIKRQKIEKKIHDFLNQSDTNQIQLSKGLAVKLKFDALNNLYNKLSSKGLSGQKLKLAFLSKYKQYRIEASVFAHEGRHSIEKKYMPEKFEKWDSEEREFHAKLSQIEFATEPRLELADMVNSASGNSGHSKANQDIIDVVIKWIKNNEDKITGYSKDKSEFSQIYLLTDDQLRECYKQADPLNKIF